MSDDMILVHDNRTPMPCRRCAMCDDLTHHWLPDVEDADPPRYCYVCKHCTVVGTSCITCDGDDDADEDCPACHGEGVLRIVGLRLVDSDEDC